MSPSVPVPWTLTAGPPVPDGGNPSVVDVGAAARAGAGFGPVVRDWNVAAAAEAAVARADRVTGLARGNGPGC